MNAAMFTNVAALAAIVPAGTTRAALLREAGTGLLPQHDFLEPVGLEGAIFCIALM